MLKNYLEDNCRTWINTNETFTLNVERIQSEVFKNFDNSNWLSYSQITEQIVEFLVNNWEWQVDIIFPLDISNKICQ